MDKVLGMVDTRNKLPKILKDIKRGERYIITQRSKAKAVIMCIDDVEDMELMADKKLLQEIKEAKDDIKAGRYKTFDQFFPQNS